MQVPSILQRPSGHFSHDFPQSKSYVLLPKQLRHLPCLSQVEQLVCEALHKIKQSL